jgi:hypothetical protein
LKLYPSISFSELAKRKHIKVGQELEDISDITFLKKEFKNI